MSELVLPEWALGYPKREYLVMSFLNFLQIVQKITKLINRNRFGLHNWIRTNL